jgi:hypothetical protein
MHSGWLHRLHRCSVWRCSLVRVKQAPNSSIERSLPGKPGAASHLERWASSSKPRRWPHSGLQSAVRPGLHRASPFAAPCLQGLSGPGCFTFGSKPSSLSVISFSRVAMIFTVRSNPSLKRPLNGGARWLASAGSAAPLWAA